jgi:hypothetical protein
MALCQGIDPTYGDAPMGIDSRAEVDGIFVSGVFSRTAMMVVFDSFIHLVPRAFSIYRLLPRRVDAAGDAKLFYPRTVFRDDTEAVGVTTDWSHDLTIAHEAFALEINRLHN